MNCYVFDKGVRAWRALEATLFRLGITGFAGALACAAFGQGSPTTVYVATNGNDAWSGNLSAPNANQTDGPKATLEGARLKIYTLKQANQLSSAGAEVLVMPGTYYLTSTFVLNTANGGTSTAPVVYRSVSPKGAVIDGSLRVTAWKKLSDTTMKARLTPATRRRVYQLDLASLGIVDLGTLKARGFYQSVVSAPMELLVNDAPMTLAQWPNAGWETVGSAQGSQAFGMASGRPRTWSSATDTWAQGFFGNHWADYTLKINSISRSNGSVTVAGTPAYGFLAGMRYRLVNAPEELDKAGEYYIDRTRRKLFFYPNVSLGQAKTSLSMLEGYMFQTNSASHVRFEGFTFTGGRGTGVLVNGGTNVSVVNCAFKGLGNRAIEAVSVSNLVLQSNEILNTGYGGIWVGGGDRATLMSSNSSIVNNDVRNYGRLVPSSEPGIAVVGVGIRVANNAIHDAGGAGIWLRGNECDIELNEIFNVCRETGDSGAVYIGRDVTAQGNRIVENLIRDCRALQNNLVTNQVQAVYLDDFASGTIVSGNAFVRCTNGLLLGGGRDNTIQNNLFLAGFDTIHVDARGMTWATSSALPGGESYNTLLQFNISGPPWSTTYPLLASYLTDDLRVPKRNVIQQNLFVDAPTIKADDPYFMAAPNTILQNVMDSSAFLVNPAQYDFGLKAGSQGFTIGFVPVNAATMGLHTDAYRLSIPNYRMGG